MSIYTPTNTPIIVLTDVHGCFYTMIRLLNQVAVQHPGAHLISLGDEIDRGPHSRQVVEFMMSNEIPSVQSNHIDLCLAFSAHARRGYRARCSSYYEQDIWLYNGGEETLANWPHHRATEDQGVPFRDGEYIPDEVLGWMQNLPAYIVPDAPRDDRGRRLLCSHTGYGLSADEGTSGGWFQALWGRHPLDDGPFATNDKGEEVDDGWFRPLGHTPIKQPVVKERFAYIDTGAAYGKRGFGNLTALVWPTKETITVPYDETPYQPTFKVGKGGCIF